VSEVEEARSTLEAVPDYFEWVLGWRSFDIGDDGRCGSRTPAGGGYVWAKGESRAKCNAYETYDAPHDGHHCGLNAYYEPKLNPYGTAHALVRGRGERFAIHPDGFRAEYAEILCFVGGRNPSDKMKAAAQRYGVPIFKRRYQAERWAKKNELGDWFPEERRPKQEIFRSKREVDWNEVPIGDLNDLLSNHYMIFVTSLWVCVLVGFVLGALNAGGVV
jgi:hypothetical protein